ncbi:MAG: type II toxin-antitoxin system PemK/MazF family toxin [Pirellulaceae bacterium]|nr:type II toxin-antitoxin system PemK/MazF family toxin [Pirellulaceae bacterium]
MREDHPETHTADEPDKRAMFEGAIFSLDNRKVWNFGEVGSDHPSVCYLFSESKLEATVCMGTSQHPGKRWAAYVPVEPDETNGLKYTTYFKLAPRTIGSRRLELMSRDRRIGRLSKDDFAAIQSAILRLFGTRS